jgi:hypothetical protein
MTLALVDKGSLAPNLRRRMSATSASWRLHHPGDLDNDQQFQSKQVRTTCPHLDATAGHVTEFAKIFTDQGREHLPSSDRGAGFPISRPPRA